MNHQITIINNPFDPKTQAWLDEYGRIGVRVKGEDTVDWYTVITENSALLDERTMIISEPFNEF